MLLWFGLTLVAVSNLTTLSMTQDAAGCHRDTAAGSLTVPITRTMFPLLAALTDIWGLLVRATDLTPPGVDHAPWQQETR